MACLIPPKEHGAEALGSKVSEIVTFLGFNALQELGRQVGWITGQFFISQEALNCASECYDEWPIVRNVIIDSLNSLNEEAAFMPDEKS